MLQTGGNWAGSGRSGSGTN